MRLNFDKGRLFFSHFLRVCVLLSPRQRKYSIYLFIFLINSRKDSCFKPLSFVFLISTTKFVSCSKRRSFRGSAKVHFPSALLLLPQLFLFSASPSPRTQLWPTLDVTVRTLPSLQRPPDVTRIRKEAKCLVIPIHSNVSGLIRLTSCCLELMHYVWTYASAQQMIYVVRQWGRDFVSRLSDELMVLPLKTPTQWNPNVTLQSRNFSINKQQHYSLNLF